MTMIHGLAASFFVAVRSVLRQRRRTAIAASAIAFGASALILAGAFIEWDVVGDARDHHPVRLGHIQIARAGYHDGGTADLERFRLPAQSPALDILRRDSRVTRVAPRLSFAALVSKDETTLSFLVKAWTRPPKTSSRNKGHHRGGATLRRGAERDYRRLRLAETWAPRSATRLYCSPTSRKVA